MPLPLLPRFLCSWDDIRVVETVTRAIIVPKKAPANSVSLNFIH